MRLVALSRCRQLPPFVRLARLSYNRDEERREESVSVPKKPSPSAAIDPRVWPISLSTFLMGTSVFVVIPIMPLFAQTIGVSTTEFGAVVGVMGATRLLFNIPAAVAAERFGRKPLLVGGPVLSAIGMSATGLSRSFFELCGWRALVGTGSSLQLSASSLYLADISHPANRARTMAPLHVAFNAGSFCGPLIGGLLAQNFGLGFFFFLLISAAPFAFVGVSILAVAANNTRLPETHPVSRRSRSFAEEFRHVTRLWKPLLKDPSVRACTIANGMYWMVASGCQFALMPMYAAEVFGLSPSSIGFCFTGIAAVNILGAQPAAWLSDRFGRKKTLIPSACIIAAATAALPFATTIEEFALVLGAWALGGSMMASAPSAYMADITTPEERPHGLALLRSAGDAGLMVGAGLMGLIADSCGSLGSAFYGGSALTVSIFISCLLSLETRRFFLFF